MKFELNQIVFDRVNKESIRISNGKEEGDVFTPTEAIAYRVVGFDAKAKRAIIAYTHRLIKDVSALCPITPCDPNPHMAHLTVGKYFIGRI